MSGYAKNEAPLPRLGLPEPIMDSSPELLELYWRAWELAWDHVVSREGVPQSPYMDEAFSQHTIWIWDTCFMVHFCKYAPHIFPGIESFSNFYAPMHSGVPSTLKIHHPDNPPLFAWIEWEYYRFTGDKKRLSWLINETEYLQKHYDFLETCQPGGTPPYANCVLKFKRVPEGYHWSGTPSGMDNTPRGRGRYDSMLWIDALAQQGLSALHIARIADAVGNMAVASEYQRRYEELKALANKLYWDVKDGFYYDIDQESLLPIKVKTPASFWALLSGFASVEQAAAMLEALNNEQQLGGTVPWPSVSRNDEAFDPRGTYWRGAVWLPTAYMATKALEKYGYHAEADITAERLVRHMEKTFRDYSPHTIWEAYNPGIPTPSTNSEQKIVRPDFCGWSALGPISLFIENVLGFHQVDAVERRVEWRKHQKGRHGIKRLRFGDVLTDIVADGDMVTVNTNIPYTLTINGVPHAVCGERTEIRCRCSEIPGGMHS